MMQIEMVELNDRFNKIKIEVGCSYLFINFTSFIIGAAVNSFTLI